MPPNRTLSPLNFSRGAPIHSLAAGNGVAAGRKPSPSSRTLPQRMLRNYTLLMLILGGMLFFASISSMDFHLPRVSMHLQHLLRANKHLPGSVYRSPEMFRKFWPAMQLVNDTSVIHTVWKRFKAGEAWVPCLDRQGNSTVLPPSSGYVIVEANGGLNQQRLSICNAVAVAKLLNATLVIPGFHLNSVWQDSSTFGEIYDEEHFIRSLEKDIRVVKRLPDELMERFGNMSSIYKFRIKALSPPSFYIEQVLPKLLETGVIRITPFAKRLSYDHMPLPVQRLRCFANYEALRFAKPIADTAKLLVERMVQRSSGSDGKYVSVHLRFEKDMVAFSCCVYDGDEDEKRVMDAAREDGWNGKFTRRTRVINPGSNRRNGQCPLTPLEVGMMLRGMGFTNSTPLYIASGNIYQEEKNMFPLKQMFPALETKETLLSPEELEPFKKHKSRLAALDYTVCLYSEVFVATQGGNFPHFLFGHRRFLNNGHAKTIKPDKRKLVQLLDNSKISWESFSRYLHAMRKHNDLKGHEMRKPVASIYTYPAPDCMCSPQQPQQVL